MTKDVEALKGLVLRNPAILRLEEDEDEARNLVQYAARYDVSKSPPACPIAGASRNVERALHHSARHLFAFCIQEDVCVWYPLPVASFDRE